MEQYKANEARAFIINSWLSRPVLNRVERLIVQSDTSLISGWIASLCSPMPLLHVMIMKNKDPRGVLMLPAQILAGEHPASLRRLRLNGCLPTWTSPLFSKNLTHLELSLPRMLEADIIRLPELATFRNIVSSMTSLEYLKLQDVYLRTSNGLNGVSPYTFPSRFKEFEMRVHNSSSEMFLNLYGAIWDTFRVPPTGKITTEVTFHHLAPVVVPATLIDPHGDLILRPLRELDSASHPAVGLKIVNKTRMALYYAVGSPSSLDMPLNPAENDLGDWAFEATGRRRVCASGSLSSFVRLLPLSRVRASTLR